MPRHLLLVALCAVALGAHAFGLGKLQALSGMNEPFEARIPLTGLVAEDIDTVKVGLAPEARFHAAHLERTPYLLTLQFEVKAERGKAPYIRVHSPELMREPYLSFMVEASMPGGKLAQQYTVLFDPPKGP